MVLFCHQFVVTEQADNLGAQLVQLNLSYVGNGLQTVQVAVPKGNPGRVRFCSVLVVWMHSEDVKAVANRRRVIGGKK